MSRLTREMFCLMDGRQVRHPWKPDGTDMTLNVTLLDHPGHGLGDAPLIHYLTESPHDVLPVLGAATCLAAAIVVRHRRAGRRGGWI